MKTLRQIQSTYDRLRRRYYLDAEPPLEVPPPARELVWTGLSPFSPNLAETHFDQDGDPHEIRLSSMAIDCPKHARRNLLHELSHMRNPRANCSKKDAWWKAEIVRLAEAGALVDTF